MKKLFKVLIFTSLIVGIVYSNVFAATSNADVTVSKKTTATKSEVFYTNNGYNMTITPSTTTSDLFMKWGCSINPLDIGYIEVTGLTQSYTTVNSLGYTLYVERLENGSWVTVKTFPVSLNYDKVVDGHHTLPVVSGYYYRVRGVHFITYNGVTSYNTSTTNSMYL